MIFAIGTNDSVFIYGTDSIKPKYALTNIHYQSITDLAWNGDKILAISSSDGYISFVIFENNELGIPYKPEEIDWDDEKFKTQYQLYFDVDINKNVMNNPTTILEIKPKKKKVNNNSVENSAKKDGNLENSNNNVNNNENNNKSKENLVNIEQKDNNENKDIKENKDNIEVDVNNNKESKDNIEINVDHKENDRMEIKDNDNSKEDNGNKDNKMEIE